MQTIVNLSLLRCFTFDLSAMQSYQSIVSISQWYSYEMFCIDSILLSNNAVVYQNILIKWSKCDQMRLSFIFIFPLKWRRFRWVLPSKFWHNFIIFLVLRFNPSVYGTCWFFFFQFTELGHKMTPKTMKKTLHALLTMGDMLTNLLKKKILWSNQSLCSFSMFFLHVVSSDFGCKSNIYII